ncbi:hypothetical protein AZZ62_003174, partial [Klebsiella variicola]
IEDHQRDGGGFGHDAPVGQLQGRHLAQRVNLPQTLARRTGLVKALHVNHLVGNIGQGEHQLANRRAPSRHAINGNHGLPPG